MRSATSTLRTSSPRRAREQGRRRREAGGRLSYEARRVSADCTPAYDLSMSEQKSLREISCADDYDPNSMPVDRARELIRTFLVPVTAHERVHLRAALGRTLATDITSPFDVPGHDSSAMDGYALRFADLSLERETTLER